MGKGGVEVDPRMRLRRKPPGENARACRAAAMQAWQGIPRVKLLEGSRDEETRGQVGGYGGETSPPKYWYLGT